MPKDFNYIVARFDKDSTVTFQEFFYTESPTSFPIVHKGQNGIALGSNNPYSVQRAAMLGWSDITDEYMLVQKTKSQNEDSSEEETESMVAKQVEKKPVKRTTKKRTTTAKKKTSTRGRKKA